MSKLVLITFFALISFSSIGQNSKFWFYDACTSEIKILDYTVVNQDTLITVENGKAVKLPTNGFILETSLRWDEKYTWFYFNLSLDSTMHYDTLYLSRTRAYSRRSDHPITEDFKFYNCHELLDGKVVETDSNGTIIFLGKFIKGVPVNRLDYFNRNGEKIRREFYANGKLVKMKGYFPDNKRNRP